MHPIIKKLFVISLILLSLASVYKAKTDTFKVGLSHTMSYFDTETFANELLISIYKPLGLDVAIEFYPTGEGLVRLEKGLLDADFSRFPSVVENYSHILKVPTPFFRIKFYYFCINKKDCKTNEITLVPTSILKAKTLCRDKDLNCKFIRTDRISIFNMLTKKHGTTLISSMLSSDICHTDIKKIYRKEIPELSIAQYHYIHKKHQNRLKDIDQQLKRVETVEGIENIRKALIDQVWSCGIDVIDID